MELNIRLSEVFLGIPGGVYSIHQIAKKLEIPYGTAYNRIHELGRMGIVQIIPQGKAKLCRLNPDNPMSAAILGLGAASATAAFLLAKTPVSHLVGKLKEMLESKYRDQIHSVILLNAESVANLNFDEIAAEKNSLESPEVTAQEGEESPQDSLALDLFLVMTEESFEMEDLETSLIPATPQNLQLRITRMVVTPSTLLGMLQERENEAGLSAYHMLRKGVILMGFDRFFNLVLRAFANLQLRS